MYVGLINRIHEDFCGQKKKHTRVIQTESVLLLNCAGFIQILHVKQTFWKVG
jgi:hypothetical protein